VALASPCSEVAVMAETASEDVMAEIARLRAALARVEELAEQLVTATHPTVGGTFAAGIGHKILAAIEGGDEDCRHVYDKRNVCTLCGHDPLAAIRAAQAAHDRRRRANRVRRAPRQPQPGTMRLRPSQPREEGNGT
jgi:hypothetical protein